MNPFKGCAFCPIIWSLVDSEDQLIAVHDKGKEFRVLSRINTPRHESLTIRGYYHGMMRRLPIVEKMQFVHGDTITIRDFDEIETQTKQIFQQVELA